MVWTVVASVVGIAATLLTYWVANHRIRVLERQLKERWEIEDGLAKAIRTGDVVDVAEWRGRMRRFGESTGHPLD